ncbi:MAG: WD40/YVTN/BNR-like repeat-containing protein, partial [Polyangia bacterium]
VFAVGSGGAIYTTSDDGAHWNKLAAPTATGTTAELTAVWAASPTDVYAVGFNGTIVHSSNGTTFTKYAGANAPTDHGATWAPVTISGFTGTMASGQTGYSVFALGADVWVAGDSGLIYHSTDGSTFTQQPTSPVNALITQIRGVSGHLIAILATDPGQYISSNNAGATWNVPTMPSFNDNADQIAFVPDESALYAFGAFSPVYSDDKGGTWKQLYTVMFPNNMTAAFAFAGNDVFIVGQTGIIHYGN